MEQPESASSTSRRSLLESRIGEVPQLVADYVRLAQLLEEAGDRREAAALLQRAQFFLPNGPAIQAGIRRLSEWVDTTPRPVTVTTAVQPSGPEQPEVTEEEAASAQPAAPERALEDDFDRLIEGLGKARLGDANEAAPRSEGDWSQEDGLIATETLAQIFESQGQFAEAVTVYQRLAEKEPDPEKAAALREKAEKLLEKIRDSG